MTNMLTPAVLVLVCLTWCPISAANEDCITIAIRGIVTDAAGELAPGATVRVARRTTEQLWYGEQQLIGTPQTTGEDGAFEFKIQPHAVYTVIGERGDAVDVAGTGAIQAEDREAKLTLLTATEFSGRVVDEAGEGVAGAVVAPYGNGVNQSLLAGSDLLFGTATDDNGAFRQARALATSSHVIVAADGYVPLIATVPKTPADEQLFIIKPGQRLSGRVLSVPEHEAVAGVPIVCVPATRVGSQSVMSDNDGRFEFTNLTTGRARLAVRGPAWVLAGQPVEVDIGAATPADARCLYVTRTGSVEGRFIDPATGQGVEGASVEIAHKQSNMTGSNGFYRVVGIPPGTHYCNYREPRTHTRRTAGDAPRVDVRSGETTTFDIRVSPARAIVGRIVDQNGLPVDSAAVNARREGGRTYSTETAHDGSFTLYGFETDDVIEIFARKYRYIDTVEYGVPVTRTGLKNPTMVLPIGGSVRGKITDVTGKPVPDATVYVEQDTPGVTPQAGSNDEGLFGLCSVQPGRRVVKVWRITYGQDDLRAEAAIDVIAGETSTIDFRLPAVETNTYSGWVRDEAGRPVAGVPVGAWAQFRNVIVSVPVTLTDSDGHFELQYYGPGPCRATANVDGYSILQERRPLGNGAALLELKPLPLIQGRVVSAKTSEPISQFCMVTGTSNYLGDWVFARQFYDPNGCFSFRPHEKGSDATFRVAVRTPDGREVEAVVTSWKEGDDAEELVLAVP